MKHFINKHSAVIEKILTISALCFILFTMLVPTLSAVITPVSAAEDYSDYLGTWQFDETLDIYSYLTEEFEVYTGFSFIANYEGTTFTCEKIMLEAYDSETQLLTFYLGNSSIIYYDTISGWQFSNIIIVTHCNAELADILETFAHRETTGLDYGNLRVGQKRLFNETLTGSEPISFYMGFLNNELQFNSITYTPTDIINNQNVQLVFSGFGNHINNFGPVSTFTGFTWGWLPMSDRQFIIIDLPKTQEAVDFVLLNSSPLDDNEYYQQGYEDGKNDGYTLGYGEGLTKGEDIGFENGVQVGFDEGYEKGLGDADRTSYEDGYHDGYYQGQTDIDSGEWGANFIGDTLSAPFKGLNQFTLFEYENVLGIETEITLGHVVGGLIAFCLFIAFLKLFAGG